MENMISNLSKDAENLPSVDPEWMIHAKERYKDLCEFFGNDKDAIESILQDRTEFKKWLERLVWHVRKCDELTREKAANPEWKPCTSDTKPQNEEEVLTTYIVNGNYKNCLVETATWFDVGYWSSPWDEFRAPGTKKEVIAWMPLPQPYQPKINRK